MLTFFPPNGDGGEFFRPSIGDGGEFPVQGKDVVQVRL